MTVGEMIELAKGESLAQLAVKNDPDKVVGYMNLGLIDLYKRFKLRTEEHIIELVTGTNIYDMPDDFMTIVAAYDEVPEYADYDVAPLAVNEEDNPLSINTIGYKQIQVPISTNGAYISIIYSAVPATLLSADSLDTVVPLPPQLTEAMMEYIGYKGHKAVDNGIQSEAVKRQADYENVCAGLKLEGEGATADDVSMLDRLRTKGFI